MSTDGGGTWRDLGGPGRHVNTLALGVDGRYFYAATQEGVFRLALR